jgi:hypothetical protein
VCHPRPGINKVGNRFGLKEIHPTIRDGAPCEFPRKRLPRTRGNERAEDKGWHDSTTMDGYLHYILTCVALRSSKQCDEGAVNESALRWMVDGGKANHTYKVGIEIGDDAPRYSRGIRATQPDESNGPTPRRGCYRSDGVFSPR